MSVKKTGSDKPSPQDSSRPIPPGKLGEHEVHPVEKSSGPWAWLIEKVSALFSGFLERISFSEKSAPTISREDLVAYGQKLAGEGKVVFCDVSVNPGQRTNDELSDALGDAISKGLIENKLTMIPLVLEPTATEQEEVVLVIIDKENWRVEFFDPKGTPIQEVSRNFVGLHRMMPRSISSLLRIGRGMEEPVSFPKKVQKKGVSSDLYIAEYMKARTTASFEQVSSMRFNPAETQREISESSK